MVTTPQLNASFYLIPSPVPTGGVPKSPSQEATCGTTPSQGLLLRDLNLLPSSPVRVVGGLALFPWVTFTLLSLHGRAVSGALHTMFYKVPESYCPPNLPLGTTEDCMEEGRDDPGLAMLFLYV